MRKLHLTILTTVSLLILGFSSFAADNPIFVRMADSAENYGSEKAGLAISSSRFMDLNGDGQKEKLVITTKIGGSMNFNSVKVFNSLRKEIGRFNFSSDGGLIIGKLEKLFYQILVYDSIRNTNECNLCDHFFGLTLYRWGKTGKLEPVSYYKSQRKYSGDSKPETFLTEFLKNRKQAVSLIAPRRVWLDDASFKIIKQNSLRNDPALKVFKEKYRLGPWAVVMRYRNNANDVFNWDIELWEQRMGKWYRLANRETLPDKEDMASQFGIPDQIWDELSPIGD